MTVLVVEDHPLFREGILTVLDGRDRFEVVGEADSRESARELARVHRPDVAILDVSLADGDGLPLIGELSVVSPGTRCLVLSALEHAATDELYLDAEAQAAFAKTVDRPAGQQLDRSRFDRLTSRETEVFRRLADGLGAKQIAYELGISRKTVDVHRSHIMKKLELDDGLDIVRMAARLGVIDMDRWAREVGAGDG